MLLLAVVNQIDRQMMVSFAPQITADLNLGDAQFGLLTGAFFAVFYSVGGVVMGAFSDHFSRPRLIGFGLLIWSALTAVTGLARNFMEMGVARMLVSVGESSLTPAATTMLSDSFPVSQRGTALGIYFMGIPLGIGGSFLVAGLLGPVLGWRGSFLLLGLIGIALTLVVFMVKDPGRTGEPGKQAGFPGISLAETPGVLLAALRDRSNLRYAVVGALVIHVFYAGNMFSQLWLVRERGFDWQDIVMTYGLVSIAGGVTGAMTGGLLSDWYAARFAGGRAAFIVVTAVILSPAMLAFRWVDPGSTIFYLCMFSGFLMVNLVYGPMFSILQEEAPPTVRGTVTGFTMLSINIVALGLGSFLIGLASDLLGKLDCERPLTWILLGSDLATLTCIPCYLVVAKRHCVSTYNERLTGETG